MTDGTPSGAVSDSELTALAGAFWLSVLETASAASDDASAPELPEPELPDAVEQGLALTWLRDDLLQAIVYSRRTDDDLDLLGAGLFAHLVEDGDDDVLLRLKHYGVAPAVVARIAKALPR